ncbi:YigZ family protein [Tsukamurella soli]|uniref:YigZ family protein n=1 Tax=Tsukamurella soli TaxID=644556 RepID=A0ABP8JLT4_9ACTN
MPGYLTIARDGQAEIEVKRSRFLCTLRRVEDEATARAVVVRVRKEFWDARHHCSAFVLGPPPSPVERTSDDGEPAGTAGAPMLEVLRGKPVSDVVAVVTRWFGGTLLGAGGLVRAYSDSVRVALDEVGTLRRELLGEWTVTVPYDGAGRLENEVRAAGVAVLETVYGELVTLRLGVPAADRPRLAALVAGVTAGGAELESAGERWVDRV